MGATYIKVADDWKYLYRALDRDGDTVDFLLRAKRDCAAARRFLEHAIDLHGVPEKITIDKRGANKAAITSIQTDTGVDMEMRQFKYLNNIVERDHRAIKRIVRPMLGFKTFRRARVLIAAIETMHMIRKRQLDVPEGQASSAASQFYSLALFKRSQTERFAELRVLNATETAMPQCYGVATCRRLAPGSQCPRT